MKCFHCKKKIKHEYEAIHMGDGDFVCNEVCKENYVARRKDWFERIVQDEYLTNQWLMGEDV